MNEMQEFNFNDNTVRTVNYNNEVWFVAKDVCGILDIKNSRQALSRLDDDEKDTVISNDGIPGNPEKAIVNEFGLYNLILSSRKKEAKEFKHWITHDVLPSIRKHGIYAKEELLNNPDLFIEALQSLKAERERNNRLEKQAVINQPKIIFADAVTSSQTSILVAELAKILKQNGIEIGGRRMFQFLRDNGYLIKRQGTEYNMPTQYAMERGLFEIKETAIIHSDGHITVSKTPKVTGKGQSYFINMFLERKAA